MKQIFIKIFVGVPLPLACLFLEMSLGRPCNLSPYLPLPHAHLAWTPRPIPTTPTASPYSSLNNELFVREPFN